MAYEFKTRPYAHQKEALKRSLPRREFAFLMEMGSGKTKVAIDEIGILFDQKEIDAAVVIAPKGVYSNWTNREIPAHMPSDLLDSASMYMWTGLSSSREKWVAENILTYRGLAILVMNVEAVSSSSKAYEYLKKFMTKRRCAIYIDESTTIKNHKSLRAANLTKLAPLAAYRRIMTGSPVPRSPLDFFSQFNFLRPGLIGSRNYVAFRAKYAVVEQRIFGGRSVQTVTGYRNLPELTDKVKEHSFRVTKEECMDLPPKVYVTRSVDLTDEQTKAYVAMREEAFAELEAGGFATATAVITQILRLHQIVCGHITDADGNLVRLKSNRVQALLDTCDEIEGKTIVWARYREDIRAIAEALRDVYGDDSVVQYHGGVNMADREYAVNGFQDPDSPVKLFVANQSTGGYGITLTAASNVIYYSNDYDLEKRLQSEDRAHRSGQTKSVLYVDLVSPNTVDDKILESLKNKKSIADLVTGDKVREWFGV